ncbi:MAG: sulfotransferase domain-containing protein [Chlamydiota bacterium]
MTPHKASRSNGDLQLLAIYGPGRSGTTWLGSIINSHPDIAYRFEPFRNEMAVSRVRAVWEANQAGQLSREEVKQHLYKSLLPAHPLIDKPPFFPKNNTQLHGHQLAWRCARKFPLFNVMCEQLYTPKGNPTIVFKEVRWKIVQPLLDILNPRSVFVLRSPHGTISSRLRGQKAGLMPTWQCDNLEYVIEKNIPSLAKELPYPIESLSSVQKNAVLWRLEAEVIFEYLHQHPEHMLLLYEDLCIRPLEVAQEVFKHFDISWHQQTENFITQSTSQKPTLRNNEKGINSYFSVARNTTKMAHRWSKELTTAEIDQIYEIISPSKAYQAYMKKGLWE